nr:MAG TPA: hypothetical protein [Caudoviricetes sp.]
MKLRVMAVTAVTHIYNIIILTIRFIICGKW